MYGASEFVCFVLILFVFELVWFVLLCSGLVCAKNCSNSVLLGLMEGLSMGFIWFHVALYGLHDACFLMVYLRWVRRYDIIIC